MATDYVSKTFLKGKYYMGVISKFLEPRVNNNEVHNPVKKKNITQNAPATFPIHVDTRAVEVVGVIKLDRAMVHFYCVEAK